jgi:arylsulfatase A-like enzyme
MQALGISTMILSPLFMTNISSMQNARLHSPLPLTNYALALIANIFLVALVLWLLWIWISGTILVVWLRFCLPALMMAATAVTIFIFIWRFPSIKIFIAAFVLMLVLSSILRKKWPEAYRLSVRLFQAILVGLGVFGIFVCLQLAYLALWHPSPNFIEDTSKAGIPPSGSRPRVVWILMDELSYNQVFVQRYPGLNLPNFDVFRQTSTLFTDVEPVSDATEIAVPSIILGKPVDGVRLTSKNRYFVESPGQEYRLFPAEETPFALAQRQGMTTGVIGWFNPYCSMLAPYLNSCYWSFEIHFPSTFVVTDGFWMNVADPWARYWIALKPHQEQRPLIYRAKIFEDLTERANKALAQDQPDFLFIHIPIPHPPGYYNRRTGQFDASGQLSYVDNLALADKILGQFISTMHASPRWANTSIVICGDHSWRTFMWRSSRYWTQEEEAASHGGVFDPRPMLMIHEAGQSTPATVSYPFPLIHLHGILNSQILGKQPDFH